MHDDQGKNDLEARRRALRTARLVLVLVTLVPAPVRAAGIAVVDVTPAFAPGAYVGLSVDAQHPDRVAITTEDGVVSLSEDGGATARTALVIAPREYLSAPLRSAPSLVTTVQQDSVERTQLSGIHGEPPGVRYFLHQLNHQLPVAKWQYWMSLDNPATTVFDVAWLPPASLLAATASGLFVGGARALGFTQLIGAPHPRGERTRVRALDVDPTDPSHLLVATADGVVVSHDGGHTFAPLADLEGVDVQHFTRDPGEPAHLFALAGRTLFQSRDDGRSFQSALGSEDGINAVAVDERGAYVATGRGLMLPGSAGRRRWHAEENIVGVVAIGSGWLLVASEEHVWLVDDAGGARPLLDASASDPILRLEGSGAGAWVLTRRHLQRLTTARVPRLPATRAPRLLLSLPAVEAALLRRAGLDTPTRTRLGAPSWTFLLPRVNVTVAPALSQDVAVTWDALVPLGERMHRVGGSNGCCGAPVGSRSGALTVMLSWDLSGLISARQPSHPFGLVESTLRATREQLLTEVRWRYRDAAMLAGRLGQPAADELQQFQWESRLAEQAAYLQAMTGRPVVAVPSEESSKR